MARDVVTLIMNDHRELEALFERLRREPEQRLNLVPVMLGLLAAHSRAEESEVYPAAAEAGIEGDVEHSQKEHLEADQLAQALASTDVDSPEFDSALAALVEAVAHHVDEEESSVLPGLGDGLTAERLAQLGEAFVAARREHLGDPPGDLTKAQLEQQAVNAGIGGATSMSKDELSTRLKARAEE